jgi:hypothetical protein
MSLGFITNTLQGKETSGGNGRMASSELASQGGAGEGSLKPRWKLLCIAFEWFDEHLAELFKLLRTPDFLCE